ncbi:MAG: N-methyl-D-aspartate receptor NMDAR2C subunit [Planctomycetota bacterium]
MAAASAANLRARWDALLALPDLASRALPCPDRQRAAETYDELEQLYSEPHRHYHNLDHIDVCLRLLAEAPHDHDDSVPLQLAIWFHDAVYQPLRGDNEEESAALAKQRLTALDAPKDLVTTVADLILVTKHDREPTTASEKLLLDIDLNVLGAARSCFEEYEAAIRREYRRVPGPLYRRKRKAILQAFLARPALYHTSGFRQREGPARANLLWAISRL